MCIFVNSELFYVCPSWQRDASKTNWQETNICTVSSRTCPMAKLGRILVFAVFVFATATQARIDRAISGEAHSSVWGPSSMSEGNLRKITISAMGTYHTRYTRR
jgi:hypothetical protein